MTFTRGRSAAAGALAGLALCLSACGGQAAAEPTGVAQSDVERIASAASHHASTNAGASASASSSSTRAASGTTKPADYSVPAAAKAHTTEGAKAFVKFYWKLLDDLDASPKDGFIQLFAAPECQACTMQASTIAKNVKNGTRIEGSTTTLSEMEKAGTSTIDQPVFTFAQIESAATRIKSTGERKSLPRHTMRGAVRLVWAQDHWLVGAYGADPA